MNEAIDKIQLKNAIRLLCGGFMYDDETRDINEIPKILKELADEYQDIITKL